MLDHVDLVDLARFQANAVAASLGPLRFGVLGIVVGELAGEGEHRICLFLLRAAAGGDACRRQELQSRDRQKRAMVSPRRNDWGHWYPMDDERAAKLGPGISFPAVPPDDSLDGDRSPRLLHEISRKAWTVHLAGKYWPAAAGRQARRNWSGGSTAFAAAISSSPGPSPLGRTIISTSSIGPPASRRSTGKGNIWASPGPAPIIVTARAG